ncbi:MAG: hypothetical protein E7Z69_08305 [Thermoplasmata archaeon]|nr:hypothetical protein [Thermoplasmata archaeon]
MNEKFWIPEDKMERVKKNNRGGTTEPSNEHGKYIYDSIERAIEVSRAYRDSKKIDSAPLMHIKMRKGVMNNTSAKSNGLTVEYSFKDGYELVSVTDSSLKTIHDKVGEYRETFEGERKNKSLFDDIQEFSASTHLIPKISDDIVNVIDTESFDCRVSMIVEGLGADLSGYYRNVMDVFERHDVKITEDLQVFQGLGFIDIQAVPEIIEELVENPAVLSVNSVSMVSFDCGGFDDNLSTIPELDTDVDISSLPIVCVFDTGVRFPEALSSVVAGHDHPDWVIPGDSNHGTEVASKLVFGNIKEGEKLRPRCRVYDYCITDGRDLNTVRMAGDIRKAVGLLHDTIKVYVISINRIAADGEVADPLTIAIDELTSMYGVRFVVSSGNTKVTELSIEEMLDDSDSNIRPPADAISSITVGSVNGMTYEESNAVRDEPCIYTCKGPGRCRVWKPDLVVHSAVPKTKSSIHHDEYSRVITPYGIHYSGGTSFAAPYVAGRLETIRRSIVDDGTLLSTALLIASAYDPEWEVPISYLEKENVVGYGVLPDDDAVKGTRIILLHQGIISTSDDILMKIPMPTDMDVSFHTDERPKVKIVCVSNAIINHHFGEKAVLGNVAIYTKDGAKNGGAGMDIWSTLHRRTIPLRQDEEEDWTIRLSASSRGIMKGSDIQYAICITIHDPDGYDLANYVRRRQDYPEFVTLKDVQAVKSPGERAIVNIK